MDPPKSNEVLIRLGCFVGVSVALAFLEVLFPRRTHKMSRASRWPSNIGVSALNQVIVRLILPVSTIALAVHAEQNAWGLFGQLALVPWIEVIAAILFLDLAIYAQHRLYHAAPVLWRLHSMHHADIEFDVSTGIRFHPLSVILSALIKLGMVVVIGPAPIAVLVFEVLLNATSLFNHSNVKIPDAIESVLRRLVVTPDMHRVHHSTAPEETNSNFGFNFPLWDRLFNTYRAHPQLSHHDMVIGLDNFRHTRERQIHRMLSQPFR